MPPLSIFDYIREINKLSSKELSPGQFKLMIEITLRSGTNGKTWPKNSDLSIATAIKKDSIKVLLSGLKKKRLIFINKEDGRRIIRLGHPTERKELMIINKDDGKKLMVINPKLTSINPLIKKEKGKKILKEKMLPQGIFFENYFKNLPSGIAGNIQKKTVEFYWENGFKDDLIRAAAGMESWPEKDRIKAFQAIINAFKRKLPMKNEQINIDQKAEYDIVWADAAENNGDILKNIGTRL